MDKKAGIGDFLYVHERERWPQQEQTERGLDPSEEGM